MTTGPAYEVRFATTADEAGWRSLWLGYCEFYAVTIVPEVTDLLWRRILDPQTPIHALVAEDASGALIGMANYVLHPFTWGTGQLCYLEDLFVVPEGRGMGVGRALIETLIALARQEGWPRVYWHTHELNEPARSLYDAITPRDPFVRYVVRVGE
jgi:GNAT superfamily N-acetyltransferase